MNDPVPPVLEVGGEARSFCCQGCAAVCRAILDSGHGDYYRYRDAPAGRADPEVVPEFLRRTELYDRPDIQRGFVREAGDWREASLILEDIRCAACLWLNERHLRSLDGILEVEMDYTSERVRVRWDPSRIRLSEILQAIARIGYIAHPFDATHRDQLATLRRRRGVERLIFAGLVGMMVMQFSLASYVMGAPGAQGTLPLWVMIGRWTSLFATAAILIFPGQEFFAGALRDLRARRLGMDLPIVLGLSVAWLGSLYATVTRSGEVYFDSIAMFVFLVLLARHLELKGRLVAARAIDGLERVIPDEARRVESQGTRKVPVVDLAPEDRVRILPGERVPVDGILETGSSTFDESVLTGESDPRHRTPGDAVLGGSINGDQPVVIRVSRCSRDSTVSEIQRLTRRGLGSRPRFAELADRAAAWFVGAILVIAAVTAGIWWWVDPAQWIHSVVAVLIVTCPCALALATPVAVTLSAARLAELGFLPLRMRGLEPLATASTLVFDKTGTLTEGRPRVVAAEFYGERPSGELRDIAAAMERDATHPFAQALREQGAGDGVTLTQGMNHPGCGVEAHVGGESWRLGNVDFVESVCLSRMGDGSVERLRERGLSVVALGNARGVQALFGISDPLRPGLPSVLSSLRALGVRRTIILSGDHEESVRRIAGQLGIDEFHGGLVPDRKLAWIRRAQDRGERVIMVGDGINDAPTLAGADASVSFGEATTAAQASSDFLLVKPGLEAFPQARNLARRTRRIIIQNLVWAGSYNLLAVPLAALGYIPPWGAAIGMSLSSLLVVANSLRLRGGGRGGGHRSESGRIDFTRRGRVASETS